MKRNSILNFIALALFSCSFSFASDLSNSDLLKLIGDLQEQVNQQRNEIQALRMIVDDQNNEVSTENAPVAAKRDLNSINGDALGQRTSVEDNSELILHSHAALKEVAGVKLGKMIDGLSI